MIADKEAPEEGKQLTDYEIQLALETAFIDAEKSDRTIERALHFRAAMIRLKQDLTALVDRAIAQQDEYK